MRFDIVDGYLDSGSLVVPECAGLSFSMSRNAPTIYDYSILLTQSFDGQSWERCAEMRFAGGDRYTTEGIIVLSDDSFVGFNESKRPKNFKLIVTQSQPFVSSLTVEAT